MLSYLFGQVRNTSRLLVIVAIVSIATCAHADKQKILVMGDSLSAAYRMPAEQGWVTLLENQLAAKSITVVNSSVSGATTSAGLQILSSALAEHKPNIVILELGANDGLQGKPLPYIYKNLERLITLIEEANSQIVLVGIRLPPNYGSSYTEPFFDQYAELAQRYSLAYVPFLLDGVAGNPDLMMSDGLHPKPEAQTIVLSNVAKALFPLLDLTDAH